MAPELTFRNKPRVAVVGAGPAGCICAKFLQPRFDVTIFDKGKYLRTLLPTGGGRCNLAHAEYDFRELVKNYPRGEKFLYSVFSRFATNEALDFFKSIGVQTYVQDDKRIFPVSNSAKDVRIKLLNSLSKTKFVNEKITYIEKMNNCFNIETDKSSYIFEIVVIATGGHSDFNLIKNLGINIIEPVQSLVGLVTKEDFSELSGVSFKDICIKLNKKNYVGDILFTHKGISGPLIYKISSINARVEFPYKLNLKLIPNINFQEYLDKNANKTIKNLISQLVPKSFSSFLLSNLGIEESTPCHKINGKLRDKIYENLISFPITVFGKVPDGEVVTCGGVDLKELNPKTLESKNCSGLYFCGEILDIDGFCGGFNLQNCWSTGYLAAKSITESFQVL